MHSVTARFKLSSPGNHCFAFHLVHWVPRRYRSGVFMPMIDLGAASSIVSIKSGKTETTAAASESKISYFLDCVTCSSSDAGIWRGSLSLIPQEPWCQSKLRGMQPSLFTSAPRVKLEQTAQLIKRKVWYLNESLLLDFQCVLTILGSGVP